MITNISVINYRDKDKNKDAKIGKKIVCFL